VTPQQGEKIALVTGAGSGIGAAIARRLAESGVHVFATDRDASAASTIAREIGGTFLDLDVTDDYAWRENAKIIADRHGRLDVLVHNAGVCAPAGLNIIDRSNWSHHHDIMAAPILFGTQALLPVLARSKHASIVIIASITAHRGFADIPSYSAAKGAALAAMRSIAVFAQDAGLALRCNAVCPGDIETPMQQRYDGREACIVSDGVLPKGTPGSPDDVAAAVLYLTSDAARFVTGIELVVDNGATMRSGW
jgi:3(or 17)beta-hydroxysteroid dehydrogenase